MKARFPLQFAIATVATFLAAGARSQDEPLLLDVPIATTSLRATFLAVGLDEETLAADRELVKKLNVMLSTIHFGLETYTYETVVEMLSSWDRRDPLVARLTPYVYLAAESLGADLVPLATYRSSATGNTTYHSWLVVRKRDFEAQERPTPADVVQFVKRGSDAGVPVRFGYHSRFSTSSYFVPALFFLANNIFHMPQSTGKMLAIKSFKIDGESSSELVRKVARGELVKEAARGERDLESEKNLDLAAVWDGTRKKFCEPADGKPGEVLDGQGDTWLCSWEGVELYSIRLPTELPNDLLVCSASVEDSVRRSIANAIKLMDDINRGDFDRWEEIGQAGRARFALA